MRPDESFATRRRFGPVKTEHDALAPVPPEHRTVAAVGRLRDGASRALHALRENRRRTITEGMTPDPTHLIEAQRELESALEGLEGS